MEFKNWDMKKYIHECPSLDSNGQVLIKLFKTDWTRAKGDSVDGMCVQRLRGVKSQKKRTCAFDAQMVIRTTTPQKVSTNVGRGSSGSTLVMMRVTPRAETPGKDGDEMKVVVTSNE